MSRFTRFFSGKFQYFGNCAGVKHLTNIMSGLRDINLWRQLMREVRDLFAKDFGGFCFRNRRHAFTSPALGRIIRITYSWSQSHLIIGLDALIRNNQPIR